MSKKPPKPPASGGPKPPGIINQTGNRPGGTVTGSYKPAKDGDDRGSKDKRR